MPEKTHSGAVQRPDWRNAEDYCHMLDYDATNWAGEWLSRNPEFLADLDPAACCSRKDALCADHGVSVVTCAGTCALSRWGVRCCLTNGGRPLFFWLPQHNSHVLEVEAVTDQANGFDLRSCSLLKAVLRGKAKTHLLFSDGARTLQIDVQGVFDLDKPVSFRGAVQGWQEFATKPLNLLRICQLYRQGRLVKALYPKEQKARRWIELLRAWDGLQAGAKQRDVADVLFGTWAAHEGWEDGCRARVQRLMKSAKRMVGGGHLALLWKVEGRKISLHR